MKKLSLLLLAIVILLSACSNSTPDLTSYTDENDNFVIETAGRRSVHTSNLPISVPYNDKSITLNDVSFYQNCPDYSHALFIVITIDVSELDDTEIHWLRESDLRVDSYITCDTNEYDFDFASSLGSLLLTDRKELVVVKTSSFSKENRYGFENSEVSTCISVSQEETFEYKSSDGTVSELNKQEEITHSTTIGDSIPDAEDIEKPLYDYIADWLYSKANKISPN